MSTEPWLTVTAGHAPLVVSLPHTGTDIPPELEARLICSWRARKDADWWIDWLYDFAAGLGATILRTSLSRTVVDVNRDPFGASLYPGQATTYLCPTTTFDGELLYPPGEEPDEKEVATRRASFFDPYHATLAAEIARLKAQHPKVVLYDCHSIRSVIPRLFAGELPQFNIGTNNGASADPVLARMVQTVCANTGWNHVVNGRFRGGYITRHYGRPVSGVHAIQMELACHGYIREPLGPVTPDIWPVPYDEAFAAPMRAALTRVFEACLAFARS